MCQTMVVNDNPIQPFLGQNKYICFTKMPPKIRVGRSEIPFTFCQLFVCWFQSKIVSWG